MKKQIMILTFFVLGTGLLLAAFKVQLNIPFKQVVKEYKDETLSSNEGFSVHSRS
jgi:hypothetical protein